MKFILNYSRTRRERFSMKTAKKKESKKDRIRARRRRAAYWLAMSAMGTVTAYAVVGGKMAPPSYAAAPVPRALWTQAPAAQRFNIPPGLLDDVIGEFERATGLDVVLSRSGIGNLPSPGVSGEYTADNALQQILAGTGVTFRYTGARTVTLDLSSVSETVDVTTAAPALAPSSSKYTEPLHKVPQTIQVIPQEVLEAQGVTT